MTLRELLKKKALSDLKVINREADLERVVSTVESTETPDVADFVPQNTLLITTAMAYKDNQGELCTLIASLDRLPCAGMAIKIGRFIDELDERVIDTANQRGFPLLQIPMYQTLGEVYHHILAYIWDNENENLIYALNLQKQFYSLVLQGSTLSKLLNSLGMTLKQPVFILSLFGELRGSSNSSKKEEKEMIHIFKDMSQEEKDNGRNLPYRDENGREELISVYPIRAASYNTYYLVMVEKEKKMTAVSGFVLEQILLIFGIYFYKNFYLSCNEIQMREKFLQALIEKNRNEKWPIQQILLEGKYLGMQDSAYYNVVIGKLSGYQGKKFNTSRFMRREEQYILIYEWLKNQLETGHHRSILVLPNRNEWSYILLVQEPKEDLEEKLIEFHQEIEKVLQLDMVFAYGNPVFDAESIESSYWKARASFHNGQIQNKVPYIRHYRPQDILEMLKSLSSNEIDDVCVQTLKSLAHPKDEMSVELRKTLKMYLDCHCSIIATANRLYVHRNTIRYRIKRCEEILENDLGDPEYCFQVQLSLMFTEL